MQRITTFWRSGWIGKIVLGAAGLLGLLVVCCIAIVVVAPRRPQPATAPTVAAVQPAAVAQSTAAPRPTDIPKPTNTPAPTATPKPTAIPTEVPSPTPLPEPIKLSGTGKVVTDKFTPPAAVNRVVFEHQGQRNFIVHVFKANGDEDYLVNTIGNYHGEALLIEDGPIYFEVDADGAWSAVVEPVGRGGTETQQLSGHGDTVSDAFDPPSGPVPYVVSHSGKRNFIVHLYCAGGDDFVANEIGPVDGQVVVRFGDGPCLWEVQADGDWNVRPK